jgi:hypothetical protein
MHDYLQKLNSDPREWLLQKDNPSARYHTLLHLYGKRSDSPETISAKRAIMRSPEVRKILSLQKDDGTWEGSPDSFAPANRSTIYQLIFLAELGADGKNPKIKKAADLAMKEMFPPGTKTGLKGKSFCNYLFCYMGLALRSLVLLGHRDDERIKRAFQFVSERTLEKELACRWRSHLACPWGAVKLLSAFVEIPPESRTKAIEEAMAYCARFLLRHDLSTAAYPRAGKRSALWFKFGFPRSLNSDILETSYILARAGYAKDRRLGKAVDYILTKQDELGRWKMEYSMNGRMLADIESKGEASRHLTLRALYLLKERFS